MSDEPTAEALENHIFLLHLPGPEGDAVDIRVYASPDVLARVGAVDPADEYRVVQATAGYLLARQRADELALLTHLWVAEGAEEAHAVL